MKLFFILFAMIMAVLTPLFSYAITQASLFQVINNSPKKIILNGTRVIQPYGSYTKSEECTAYFGKHNTCKYSYRLMDASGNFLCVVYIHIDAYFVVSVTGRRTFTDSSSPECVLGNTPSTPVLGKIQTNLVFSSED